MGLIYNVVTSTVFASIEEMFKVCLNKDDDNSSISSSSNNNNNNDNNNNNKNKNINNNNNNNSSLVYLCDDSIAYHLTL